MQYLSVKNLAKYQHYKDRNPPWVKLYRESLIDYKLRRLPLPSRLFFHYCSILASECHNEIPYDLGYLSERVGFPITEKVLQPLIIAEFLLASNPLASSCKQNAPRSVSVSVSDSSSSSEGRRESERRGKRPISDLDKPTEKHFEFAKQLGIDPGPEWGKFKNYCLAHDKRYANFEAAFRNWLANAKEKYHALSNVR